LADGTDFSVLLCVTVPSLWQSNSTIPIVLIYLKGDFPMYVVYVLDKDGTPLMPTKRFGHVRKLLKFGQAKAVSTKPFVIQLLYKSTKYTQPLYGGTDPGRTNIGEAVVN
jgi:hypothetical protein